MSKIHELDETDIGILSMLMKDAKTPYTDIAKQLYVSSGTIHVRMRKMEEMGLIKGSTLSVNYSELGYDVTAFLGVYLSKSSRYESVANELKKIPEVVGLNYTTGNYSMFVKIICRDTQHLRDVLHEKIQQIEDITRTETFISLQESIDRPLDLSQSMDIEE